MYFTMKQWILRDPISEKVSKKLEKQPDFIRNLLFYKGIETEKEAGIFLNPDYERDLHDPFDMLGMDKAVERIIKAIEKNERIIIFGDYDADGVSASTIFHDFFKKVGFENFHVHIPDRHLDGYGLTLESIDEFSKQDAKLILTVDCGSSDYDEVEKANSLGIDVVVTDHHIVPEKKPNAFALVNPKQSGDNYPFEYLCGAGIAFKVVQALVRRGVDSGLFNIVSGWEKWLLDVVAIATVADMVPLTDENRALVYYGLKVLKKTKRVGIHSFYNHKKMYITQDRINEEDIAFVIAPRLNIASRMEHANMSFSLLVTKSNDESVQIVNHLEELNLRRREIVQEVVSGIYDDIGKNPDDSVIVVGNKKWNPGVLGLTANRIIEKYDKPVFLWGKGEGKEVRGSSRVSDHLGVNLVDLMKSLPEGILNECGGHALAAGFSVNEDKLSELKGALIKAFDEIPKEENAEGNSLYIDKEMGIGDINWGNHKMIDQFAPFGVDNPKPVFSFDNLEIKNVKKFGGKKEHLQLDFEKLNGKLMSAIGFFMADDKRFDLESGQKIKLAATIERSDFRNFPELRLKIVDIIKK